MTARSRLRLPTVAALLLLGACSNTPTISIDWRGGPFFEPTNFTAMADLPVDVLRVAVLPPSGLDELSPESAAPLLDALHIALTASGRFEVVPVSPNVVRTMTGKSNIASTDALPVPLFDRIAETQAADAVLLTDITIFRAYPPLALGVRAKLVRLRGNRAILWAFDNVFDCRQLAVTNSARRHAAGGDAHSLIDTGNAALQSPSRFANYVFAATFATLPQRPGTVPQKTKVRRSATD